jgi:hypothetical protein
MYETENTFTFKMIILIILKNIIDAPHGASSFRKIITLKAILSLYLKLFIKITIILCSEKILLLKLMVLKKDILNYFYNINLLSFYNLLILLVI